MSCLLYCILREPPPGPAPALLGVDRQPVTLVRRQGLAAAVSGHEAPDLLPDLARVRAYAEAVNRFHSEGAVIPLRYGCRLAGVSQVAELLAGRASHYHRLLAELEGGVEMGVHFWLPGGAKPDGTPGEAAPPPGAGPDAASGEGPPPGPPGRTYLAARRALYQAEEHLTQESQQLAAGCLAKLAGLFRCHHTQGPGLWGGLSLYFLVPREGVAAFCRALQSFRPPAGARLLLSGPWPPYNLVMHPTALTGGKHAWT